LIGFGLIAACAAGQSLASTSLCVRTDPGNQNPGPACGPYRYEPISDSDGDNTYVLNDMWNPPGPGHRQTIRVHDPGKWSVVSDQRRGNTAVVSYPDVQQILTTTRDTPAPLARFAAISSTFVQLMPSDCDNEAAYDIWMGSGATTDYAQEVMIWVDDHRTNPPPGRIVARQKFAGASYTVWQDPTDGSSGFHTIYAVRRGNETGGTVNVLAMLDWLVSHHLTAATGVNQIDFGWEICSTDGRPQTFAMSAYRLGLRCRSGGTACYAS
jgi:Glycosyl hydrolase family 12